MADPAVLITGADGYLGSRLAARYAERTDAPLRLWVHARTSEDAKKKEQRLAALLPAILPARLRIHHGDLEDPAPFQGVDPSEIGIVIHAAAVTRFNVESDLAQRVNVDGAAKLLEFAGRCGALTRLGFLSTVYASGLRSGLIEEVPFDNAAGFANHYERSKWEAEQVLLSKHAALPWSLFRIATAIADDESGRVSQQNAFHNTLKLFFYGLLSLIPGNPRTKLYFVTGDFVADAVFELMRRPEQGAIYHVAHRAEESASLGELIDIAFEVFRQEEDFKQRRLLKPLFADAKAFGLLVEGVSSFGGGVVTQAVSSVGPFAPQLFVDKAIGNATLAGRLKAYRAPDPRQLVRRTCESLVHTRWGREQADGA